MSVKQIIAGVLAGVQLLLGSVSPAAAQGRTYKDVTPGKWYYEDVMDMTGKGWLNGYPDGTFQPEATITAAEYVTIVARVAGVPKAATASTYWAAGHLQAALDRGWYDWDECPPTGELWRKPISRQLAVKITMKALLPDKRGDYSVESVKMRDFSTLSGRYYDTTFAAYASGVIRGDNKGNFRPLDGLSRAEACAVIRRAVNLAGGGTAVTPTPAPTAAPAPVTAVAGGVTENGWLQVQGTQLCNEKGEPVVLHGMSSHGMQWYPQYASAGAIKTTADYGANLFRVAMYTGEGGYLSDPEKAKRDTIAAVDAAIANDLYVIIDWHILSDGNPRTHQAEAKAFFTEMAQRYKDSPAVLYEICNEPNGNVSWTNDVKPYAQAMIDAIRGEGAKGVILVGSPTWSQDIHLAAADPVQGENLMYTLHFYAGTHGQELRDRIDQVRAKGFGVFISEWGTSAADGNGGVFPQQAQVWLDFLAQRNMSWANWSLCDKNETSAALKPGASSAGGWTDSDLSESGKFVFHRFASMNEE